MSVHEDSLAAEVAQRVDPRGRVNQRYLDAAEPAYKALSEYLNNMSHSPEAFAAHLLNDHRTLQSQAISLMLKTLYIVAAAADEGHFTDPRNEAAFEKARKVRDALGDHGWAVPFI